MFKVFTFFTTVMFLYTPLLALSSPEPNLHELSTYVSEKEANAIKQEIQLRETRALEEEMRMREEQIENRSQAEYLHNENMVGQAAGIMITLKKYPVTGTQRTLLIEKLQKAELKKDTEIKRFKMWIYNWESAQEEVKAEMLCKEFLAFSFVENCEANVLIHPGYSADTVERAKKMVQQAEQRVEKSKERIKKTEEYVKKYQKMVGYTQNLVKEATQWLETAEQKLQAARKEGIASKIKSAENRLVFYKKWLESRKNWFENSKKWLEGRKKWLEKSKDWLEKDKKWLESRKEWLNKVKIAFSERPIKKPPQKKPPPVPSSDSNLKTCNIVSHKLNLHTLFYSKKENTPLSDYWAQEMIGADLLKKEMEGLPPIKKHFIQLFDLNESGRADGPGGHDTAVKNLISSNGKQAVLPELGKNIGISQTPRISDTLKYSDQMLSNAEKKCAHLKSGSSSQSPSNHKGSVQ